jgi:hypothetical protein
MNKKLILLASAAALFSPMLMGTSLADEATKEDKGNLEVKLGLDLDVAFAHRHQRSAFNKAYPGSTSSTTNYALRKYAFANSGEVSIDVVGTKDELKYGAHIALDGNVSNDERDVNFNANETMLFVESTFGRLEGGSYKGADAKLGLGASKIARATGGVSGNSKNWWNAKDADATEPAPAGTGVTSTVSSNYITYAALPLAYQNYDNTDMNANKATYYSPNLNGFSFGLSYTPDSEVYGTSGRAKRVQKKGDGGYKNVFTTGIHYSGEYRDIGLKAAVLGEFGDSKNEKTKNLRAWEAGLQASYEGFSVAGSYGDWGKSGQSTLDTANSSIVSRLKKATYWTTGVAYEAGPFGASVTYLDSQRPGYKGVLATNTEKARMHKLRNVSVGVDYKLAPGLVPYAEVSMFEMKKPGNQKGNKGTIFLAGTKLSF